jgi:hypothetical protein
MEGHAGNAKAIEKTRRRQADKSFSPSAARLEIGAGSKTHPFQYKRAPAQTPLPRETSWVGSSQSTMMGSNGARSRSLVAFTGVFLTRPHAGF